MTAIGDSTPVKTCTKCGQCKQATEEFFHKHKASKYGVNSKCRSCVNSYKRAHRVNNPDKYALFEAIRAEQTKIRRANNKEARSAKDKLNRKALSAYDKEYRAKNKESVAAYQKNYLRERRKRDPVFAMAASIRRRIQKILVKRGCDKKSRSTLIIGCNWHEFKDHIERQFLRGMSWDNRNLWHLDHIIPLASAKTADEVVALNHFTNIRPMWAKDNIRKSDAITHLI